MSTGSRWVYLVVSAAPPVLRIEELIMALSADAWSICVIATPTAAFVLGVLNEMLGTGRRLTHPGASRHLRLPCGLVCGR